MSVGLTRPTTGRVTVLDSLPAGSMAALDQIAFVAQDASLYKNLSTADMLHLTRNLNLNLNRRWDQHRAETRRVPMRCSRGSRVPSGVRCKGAGAGSALVVRSGGGSDGFGLPVGSRLW